MAKREQSDGSAAASGAPAASGLRGALLGAPVLAAVLAGTLLLASAAPVGGALGTASSHDTVGSGADHQSARASLESLGRPLRGGAPLAPAGVTGLPAGSHAIGRLAPSTPMSFDVVLRPRDEAGLQALLDKMYTPGSPEYHHFLKRGQFAARFGASSAAVSEVRSALADGGLRPGHLSEDGLVVPVTGKAAAVERALGVTELSYRLPSGRSAFANLAPPHLDAAVSHYVQAIVGLSTVVRPHPLMAPSASNACLVRIPGYPRAFHGTRSLGLCRTGVTDSLTGQPGVSGASQVRSLPPIAGAIGEGRIRAALAAEIAPQAGSALAGESRSAEAVPGSAVSPRGASGPSACSAASSAASSAGAYTAGQIAQAYGFSSGAYAKGLFGAGQTIGLFELAPYSSSDISSFESCYGITTPVSQVQVDGGGTSGLGGSAEDTLDIEDAAALAPEAKIVVYEAPNSQVGSIDDYAAIANADAAQVVSTSWGECEAATGTAAAGAENTIFEQMAAQGQTMIAAAGDSGSEDCYSGAPDSLNGIACPSSTSCIAVGQNSNDAEGVVVPVDGSSTGTPIMVSGTIALFAVACPTTTECEAVGANANGVGVVVPIDSGVPGAPIVASDTAAILAIDCPSSSGCVMTGVGASGVGVVLSLVGGTPGSPIDIPGSSVLYGIACPSTTACAVVGADSSVANPEGLVALVVDGDVESVLDVPGTSLVDAVACSGTTSCVFGGDNASGDGVVDSITDGTPGQLTVLTSATLIEAAACGASGACLLVGLSSTSGGLAVPMSGDTLGSVVEVSGVSGLDGVTCSGSTGCEAVGADLAGNGAVVPISTSGVAAGVTSVGTPAPASVTLRGLACYSSTSCLAVGDDSNGVGVVAQVTNGVAGAPVEVPGTSELSSVACSSATSCEAVGYDLNLSATSVSTLFEGVAVPIDSGTPGTPVDAPGTSELTGVACPASGSCQAVGLVMSSSTSAQVSAVTLPITDGTPGSALEVSGVSRLSSIACATSSSCEAVGVTISSSTSSVGAVVALDGGAPGSPADVSGASQLTSVACSSASACVAVGDYATGSGTTSLLLSAEGVVVPVTGGSPGAASTVSGTTLLSSVACPSTTCVAVGTDLASSTSLLGVALEVSNGVPGSPATTSSAAELLGVSCISAGACEALGITGVGQPEIVGVSNGTPGAVSIAWTAPGLDAASCFTSACLAGGSTGQSGEVATVNATSTTVGGAVSVPGAVAIMGIYCVSSAECEAVGESSSGVGVAVQVSNGTPGAAESVSSVSFLDAVSCSSTTTCEAVGENAAGEGVAVAITNGAPGSPVPVGGSTALLGIDCPTSSCEAVGAYATSSGVLEGVLLTLASGSPSAVQAVSSASELISVSCSSPGACEAVGLYEEPSTSSSAGLLAGATEGVALPVGSSGAGVVTDVPAMSLISSLACPSAGSCEAVGIDSYTGTGGVLAIDSGAPGAVTGTWAGSLSAVSCGAASVCEAVGSSPNGSGIVLSLDGGVVPAELMSSVMPIGLAVDDPASQPYVTGVGGVSLSSLGPPAVQSAWNGGVLGGAGGGGISQNWTMPSWQKGTGVENQYSTGSPCSAPSGSLCREVPDVSASADPNHGYEIYYEGSWVAAGGTSAAAPLWAAVVADTNQGCAGSTGFANPALYSHASDLQGVTTGNNDMTGTNSGLYPATAGYNMVSGLGTPTSAIFAPGVLCPAPQSAESASGLTVSPAPATTGSTSTYTVVFTTSASGALAAGSSIDLTLTAGTTLPASASDYVVTDATSSTDTVASVSVSDGTGSATPNQVSMDLSATGIGASDAVTVTISGVLNPTKPSYSYTGSLSTSSDTTAVTSDTYAIIAPPQVAGTYVPISPERLVDTRCAENPLPSDLSASYCAALPASDATLAAPAGGGKIHVSVTGVGSVPLTGVAAVLLNVTFAGSFSTGGYLSAYPTGLSANPASFSNVNWSIATYQAAVANLAVVKVGTGGQITIYNGATGYTNLIVDVEGYYLSAGASSTSGSSTGSAAGSTYVPVSPERLVDTRCAENPRPSELSASYCAALPASDATLAAPAGGGKIHVSVTGVGGVPATGVAAVLLNVTFAGSFSTGGYLSAYPTGLSANPGSFSNVNWSIATYQAAVANLAVVKVGTGGQITIYNGATGYTNLIVDVEGYYLTG